MIGATEIKIWETNTAHSPQPIRYVDLYIFSFVPLCIPLMQTHIDDIISLLGRFMGEDLVYQLEDF